MKMAVTDEMVNSNTQKESGPSPNAIGTEFARQYYTLLADQPERMHMFYSHESTLLLNEETIVGQQKIGRAFEELVGEKCRIRILCIRGTATLQNGIALQVFGEMGGRRFVQTFILASQGAKKYYVQNDLFQFFDLAFKKDTASEPSSTPSPVAEKELPPTPAPPVNGHKRPEPTSADETPILQAPPTPVVSKPTPAMVKSPMQNGDERPHKRQHTPKKAEASKATKEEVIETKTAPAHAPTVVSAPTPVENVQKTWAHLVGSNSKSSTPTVMTTVPSAQKPQAPKPPVTAGPVNGNVAPAPAPAGGIPTPQQGERRIYLGGIIRNIVPENTAAAESDIREAFSRFGEVETVAVPRKVLDQPDDKSKYAFAFITMKTATDAQNVLKNAKKDERGNFTIPLKVASFSFDGEVNVSEQKDRMDRPGGFRGGRGGFGRGGFPHRGRGGRGSFRGNHQQ